MANIQTTLSDIHVTGYKPISPPYELIEAYPHTKESQNTVISTRNSLKRIFDGNESRLIAIVGPCSIHNVEEAYEYARYLSELSNKVKDNILVIMRTYFEKPRTSIGWPGYINDPMLDNSGDVDFGLRKARELLVKINSLGLPCATEYLSTMTPQYTGDLISWACIGARTTESQTHREMASGLSMPTGFKNGTHGNLEVVINAILFARQPHLFLGMDFYGRAAMVKTEGNPYTNMVLRGGDHPNYDSESVRIAQEMLQKAELNSCIVVDCSHGNAIINKKKDPEQQIVVLENVTSQRANGNTNIKGIMIESNQKQGHQKISGNLTPGVSITDSCIGIDDTNRAFIDTYNQLKK
jgi:3-deoxy-7-phosphoheptulonate synthase